MHDRIFENQAAMFVPNLKQHARDLGLETETFDKCLDSGKFVLPIAADVRHGEQLGVNSTPTMYVNGRAVIGAQPFEALQVVIDEELARRK
jgi:protein-disulfide isomerase